MKIIKVEKHIEDSFQIKCICFGKYRILFRKVKSGSSKLNLQTYIFLHTYLFVNLLILLKNVAVFFSNSNQIYIHTNLNRNAWKGIENEISVYFNDILNIFSLLSLLFENKKSKI